MPPALSSGSVLFAVSNCEQRQTGQKKSTKLFTVSNCEQDIWSKKSQELYSQLISANSYFAYFFESNLLFAVSKCEQNPYLRFENYALIFKNKLKHSLMYAFFDNFTYLFQIF